ncbi:MAG: hypothetical protein ABIA21_02005, partial [Candidatus Aenigmatarchaeota archaeon]
QEMKNKMRGFKCGILESTNTICGLPDAFLVETRLYVHVQERVDKFFSERGCGNLYESGKLFIEN